MTCGCPIAAGDGHDFPRLIDEGVPGVAAVIYDVVEGFENSVRQPVLPNELPDIFLAVEFRCAWRKLQERDVVWNLEGLGAMPPGLIEEDNSVSARRDFGCDLIEVKLHSFGVAGRQHEVRRRLRVRGRPHRTGRSIGSFDRGRHGGVNPSWPSDRSACSFDPPASHLYMRARMSKGHQLI